MQLFGLIGDVANNNKTNEFQCSFFLFISKIKKSSAQSVDVKLVVFSNLVKVIGFRDFFLGGGGSDNISLGPISI